MLVFQFFLSLAFQLKIQKDDIYLKITRRCQQGNPYDASQNEKHVENCNEELNDKIVMKSEFEAFIEDLEEVI